MNSFLLAVSRPFPMLMFALLLMGGAVRAQEGAANAPVKDVQGLVARSLAEVEDPDERAAMGRLIFALFPEEIRRAQMAFPRHREEAEEMVDRIIDQCWELMDLKERNPERYETEVTLRQLDNQAAELARQASAAAGPQREALVVQLQAKLAAYFDLKQQTMRREAEEMKARATELENQVQRRAKNRDALLDRRLRQLLEGEVEW